MMWHASYWYAPASAAVYPDAADVWFGSGDYGPTGADYTPSKRASSIAFCESGNIKSGVTIDDVNGSYSAAPGTGGGSLVNGGLVQ